MLLLCLALLLGACAASVPLPARLPLLDAPRHVLVVQSAPMPPIVWSVVAQPQGDALRWLRFDPLGVPDARQVLQRGRWYPDGFLYPNPQAREMFAALLFAWTPDAALDGAWGQHNWRARRLADGGRERTLLERGRVRWTLRWPAREASGLEITLADGTHWQVRPWPEGLHTE